MRHLSRLAGIAILLLGLVPATLSTLADAGAAVRDALPGGAGIDAAALSLAHDQRLTLGEAERRIGWQRQAVRLQGDLERALGDRFGGVWIDEEHGGRVKVGIVGGVRDVQPYANVLGLAGVVDVVLVRHGLGELRAISDRIGTELERVNAGAAWPLGSGILTDRNGVELTVPPGPFLTPAQQALVEDAERYGDALVLTTSRSRPQPLACVYPDCDPPFRGGLRIRNADGLVECTAGFIARSRVDSKLYVVTAGHCDQGMALAGIPDTWYAKFASSGEWHKIGPTHHAVWNTNGDYAIVYVANPSGWQLPKNWIYVNSGKPGTTEPNADPEYTITNDGGSTLGMRICVSGQASWYSSCGKVTGLDQTYTYGGITVHHLGKANYDATKGDSGGPVFASHVAYGIQVAGVSGAAYYQGIHAAENGLNVNVLHSS